MDFKLNHVLGKFLEEDYVDDNLNADFIKLHGLVEDTIGQFIL